jgi:hypothetical protein
LRTGAPAEETAGKYDVVAEDMDEIFAKRGVRDALPLLRRRRRESAHAS